MRPGLETYAFGNISAGQRVILIKELMCNELQGDPETRGNDADVLAKSLDEANAVAKRLAALPKSENDAEAACFPRLHHQALWVSRRLSLRFFAVRQAWP
jgi:hypothetical protein